MLSSASPKLNFVHIAISMSRWKSVTGGLDGMPEDNVPTVVASGWMTIVMRELNEQPIGRWQNLQCRTTKAARTQREKNFETSRQNHAVSSASNCLAERPQIQAEQSTEPSPATKCHDKSGSCTVRVQASTAGVSTNTAAMYGCHCCHWTCNKLCGNHSKTARQLSHRVLSDVEKHLPIL